MAPGNAIARLLSFLVCCCVIEVFAAQDTSSCNLGTLEDDCLSAGDGNEVGTHCTIASESEIALALHRQSVSTFRWESCVPMYGDDCGAGASSSGFRIHI